jgi:hypothetical protein
LGTYRDVSTVMRKALKKEKWTYSLLCVSHNISNAWTDVFLTGSAPYGTSANSNGLHVCASPAVQQTVSRDNQELL